MYYDYHSKRYDDKDGYELSSKEIQARSVSRRGLMDEVEVVTRLQKGEKAIDLSIEKWTRIQKVLEDYPTAGTAMGLHEYIGYKSCALCLEAIRRYSEQNGGLKDSASKCTVCHLAQIESCLSKDSAYDRIDNAIGVAEYITQSPEDTLELLDDLKQSIQLMLVNLHNTKQRMA